VSCVAWLSRKHYPRQDSEARLVWPGFCFVRSASQSSQLKTNRQDCGARRKQKCGALYAAGNMIIARKRDDILRMSGEPTLVS
jgi:hypothetical protein